MKNVLYPELAPDEIVGMIDSINCTAFVEDAVPFSVPTINLPEDSFGRGVEMLSFERIARHIVDSAMVDIPSFGNGLLTAPANFREATASKLAHDILPMMIRPLADSVRPEPGQDDSRTYRRFCQQQLLEGLEPLARTYPVMWRRIHTRLRGRLSALTETFERIAEDWSAITQTFGLDPAARIQDIELSGDTHGGGRTVSIVHLADGSRFVYKPRTVDSEAAYQELCRWLNRELTGSFTSPAIVRRDGYGYAEFITTDADAPVDLFRTGSLAAVLYGLNARDMHFTNIVSTREGPVPIDLETLLHPQRHNANGVLESGRSGYQMLERSVYGTGVLPSIITTDKREGYVDVGYVGGGEVNAGGPFRQFRIVDQFSAQIRVIWAPDPVAESISQGKTETGDAAIDTIRTAAAQMTEGFTQTYGELLDRRDEFREVVHELFAPTMLRFIHNATVQYDQCLRVATGVAPSADPDLAQGLIKRIGIASRGADPRMVASECAQLWATDIPYFLVPADGVQVREARADDSIAELDLTPLEQFSRKLDTFGPQDLELQVRLIRLAFNAKLPDPHTMTDSAHVLGEPSGQTEATPGRLLDLAHAVGDQLI